MAIRLVWVKRLLIGTHTPCWHLYIIPVSWKTTLTEASKTVQTSA